MDQFGLDVGLLVSQIVNFALLAFLLGALLFKPLMAKLDERAARIQRGLDDAEHAKRLVLEAETRYAEELERARREARDIVERATRNAEQQREEILAAARAEGHAVVLQAHQQAQREIQEGQIALHEQVVNLSIAIAGRLLEQELGDAQHRQFVAGFLAELERLPS
ncbi:MAG: F0F1 ATP synthase subunit B [Chloroflexota bacterium]